MIHNLIHDAENENRENFFEEDPVKEAKGALDIFENIFKVRKARKGKEKSIDSGSEETFNDKK